MLTREVSLCEVAAELRRGERDLADFVNELCDHIDAVEPRVMAYLPEPGRRGRLQDDAATLLRRWPEPEVRPALFGVPVGIKDVLHTAGFVTRAGAKLPPELFAGPEALAVKRLKAAGALIAGRTVTAEFAHAAPGPTRNPHGLDHTPGGSSSGSAAAVACGTALLALGTQTVGSVIRPAAFCGVVGIKPSYDRIPTAGLVYWSRSADHVGLFAQDVSGARTAARLLYDVWHDEREVAASAPPAIGVPVGPYLEQAGPTGLAAFERQLEAIAEAGYTVRRVSALADIAAVARHHRLLTAAEAAAEHSEWLAAHEDLYHPSTLKSLRRGLAVAPADLAAARESQLELRRRLGEEMRGAGIELWACPAAVGPAPHGLESTGNPAMNLPWTHAGLPAVTVPAGTGPRGLPLGLQLTAAFGRDEALLAWAEGIAGVLAGPG